MKPELLVFAERNPTLGEFGFFFGFFLDATQYGTDIETYERGIYMLYSGLMVNQLAATLLQGLCVKSPTSEQYEAAESFVNAVILPGEEKTATQGLTKQEWLCLNLAAGGFSTEETADMLVLARGTIKNYRERIRQKLNCRSITQAVHKALIEAE